MRTRFLVVLLILIYIFSSCNTYRYIYSASPPNNPYFKEKGESKLAAYYSSSNDNRLTKEYAHGFDVQGAYAVGRNWALTAGYFSRREKDIYGESYNFYDFSTVRYKRNLTDLGAGYFSSLNTKKTITGNIYAGYAKGKFSFEDNGEDRNHLIYTRHHESAVNKWFIQPSFNFMPGRYVRFSFAAKFSYVHYGKIRTTYTPEELKYFSLNRIANRTARFFEPSLNIQFGIPDLPWVKIDGIISGSSDYILGTSRLAVRGSNASIGLSFDFSKLKK